MKIPEGRIQIAEWNYTLVLQKGNSMVLYLPHFNGLKKYICGGCWYPPNKSQLELLVLAKNSLPGKAPALTPSDKVAVNDIPHSGRPSQP